MKFPVAPLVRVFSVCLIAACIAPLSVAAEQNFQQPHSMSEKYRDSGVKPATGRSGSASIEMRALLGSDGVTEIEVTTGSFEPYTAPVGSIDKLQVKLLSPDGHVLQTDNYQYGRDGDGDVVVTYGRLHRGQSVFVQANVRGIDGNRTDVVTASGQVARRPNVAAVSIEAPAEAGVGSEVVVTGVMEEMNGEVGARATCSLLADGEELAHIDDAWIDAGSAVTCRFPVSFDTPGTKELTFRVSGVTPADDDASDNEKSRTIEITAGGFTRLSAYAWDTRHRYGYFDTRTFTWPGGAVGGTFDYAETWDERYQSRGVMATFAPASALDGTITFSESVDRSPLDTYTIDVAALPRRVHTPSGDCASGYLDNGLSVAMCAFTSGETRISADFLAGEVTYDLEMTATGVWGDWYFNDQHVDLQGGGAASFKDLGTLYTAELTHESPSGTRSGRIDVTRDQTWGYDNSTVDYCWDSDWGGGTEHGCMSRDDFFQMTGGAADAY